MNVYRAVNFITGPKPYSSSVCAESRSKIMHAHDFYEIAYVVENSGVHYAGGNSEFPLPIHPGDYVFVSPYAEHCTVSDSVLPRVRVCNLLITEEFFLKIIQNVLAIKDLQEDSFYSLLAKQESFCLVLRDTEARLIQNAIMTVKHECELAENAMDIVIKNSLENFLVESGRIYHRHLKEDTSIIVKNALLQELTSYIRSNLDRPLTLNLLAEHAHFSPEYLSRYFKKHMKTTISAYIMEARMQKARELLAYTSHPISEIGYLCGYSSSSNFRKYFHMASGISPSEYRRQFQHPNGVALHNSLYV